MMFSTLHNNTVSHAVKRRDPALHREKDMSHLSDEELRRRAESRRRRDEEHLRRMIDCLDAGGDMLNPLNPVSPVNVGNDYGSSDSCISSYDSGSSSDSGGNCKSD